MGKKRKARVKRDDWQAKFDELEKKFRAWEARKDAEDPSWRTREYIVEPLIDFEPFTLDFDFDFDQQAFDALIKELNDTNPLAERIKSLDNPNA